MRFGIYNVKHSASNTRVNRTESWLVSLICNLNDSSLMSENLMSTNGPSYPLILSDLLWNFKETLCYCLKLSFPSILYHHPNIFPSLLEVRNENVWRKAINLRTWRFL